EDIALPTERVLGMLLILLAISIATLLISIHPFITYPVTMLLLPRKETKPQNREFRPSLALCMSVFNEGKVITAKVRNLLEMKAAYSPAASIHIYVDGADDDTASQLRQFGEAIDLVVSTDRNGKTYGLNLLMQRCESELMCFTDGNVVTPVDGLIELASHFADPQIGCVSGRLDYSNAGETSTSAAGTLYWRFEEALKAIESTTTGVIGVDGAFFMIRRAAYEPAPPHLIDDLYVSLAALTRGYRVISAPEVVVYERSAVRWEEEFRRKRRIACQAFNVHRALWPRLRKLPAVTFYGYVSHRLLKWLSPFFALAGILTGALAVYLAISTTKFVLLCSAAIAILAFCLLIRARPLLIVFSGLTSLAGVAMGVLDSIFSNRTYTVWTPAMSVRPGD
ncbi:glycosyltransferase, partial [Stakelama sp. CBK3Z-3]